MQSCGNCSRRIRYTQILKSTLWFYTPVFCNHCGQGHEITMSSRFLVSLLVALPMVVIIFTKLNLSTRMLLYLLWATIIIFATPLAVKYNSFNTNKNK